MLFDIVAFLAVVLFLYPLFWGDMLCHRLFYMPAYVSCCATVEREVCKAIAYCVPRWTALTRFLDDGRLCMCDNAGERQIRPPQTRMKVAEALCDL
jgi:hypothetical protein